MLPSVNIGGWKGLVHSEAHFICWMNYLLSLLMKHWAQFLFLLPMKWQHFPSDFMFCLSQVFFFPLSLSVAHLSKTTSLWSLIIILPLLYFSPDENRHHRMFSHPMYHQDSTCFKNLWTFFLRSIFEQNVSCMTCPIVIVNFVYLSSTLLFVHPFMVQSFNYSVHLHIYWAQTGKKSPDILCGDK